MKHHYIRVFACIESVVFTTHTALALHLLYQAPANAPFLSVEHHCTNSPLIRTAVNYNFLCLRRTGPTHNVPISLPSKKVSNSNIKKKYINGFFSLATYFFVRPKFFKPPKSMARIISPTAMLEPSKVKSERPAGP